MTVTPGQYDHRGHWCETCQDTVPHRRPAKARSGAWVCTACPESPRLQVTQDVDVPMHVPAGYDMGHAQQDDVWRHVESVRARSLLSGALVRVARWCESTARRLRS